VGYFHLVFTLPHELNRLILANKKIVLGLLFKAVSKTLLEFGQTRLKGTIGIIAVLHTWDQTLKDHFHLHCLVPAGALSFDHSRWIAARKNFLFPVKALSRVFRGKFLTLLQQAYERGKLPAANNETKALRKTNWIIYAKKPFGSPQTVLDYLGRYTHRVALSNDRILRIENGEVTLSYRDRNDGDQTKTSSLMPRNLSVASCFTSCPRASCVSATSACWPTALKNWRSLSAANSSISIPLCRNLPCSQPKTCCLKSQASIFLAARAAVREG
jgi:hypothetical protein